MDLAFIACPKICNFVILKEQRDEFFIVKCQSKVSSNTICFEHLSWRSTLFDKLMSFQLNQIHFLSRKLRHCLHEIRFHQLNQIDFLSRKLRPCLHEYVSIENDIVFNEKETIILHLHIVFISFSYCSF